MGNQKLCYFLLLLLLPYSVPAGVLKGKVTDTKGAPLPYATVFIEGTTMGVNTNGDGEYLLNVTPGFYKVRCQYIGYQQGAVNLSIKDTETIKYTFVLKDQALEMKEVVVRVSSEDPAYSIIRKTIKRRKFHFDQVHSFQTAVYIKGVARSRKLPKKIMGKDVKGAVPFIDSSGKGVLFLTEENANYYSDGKREKTIIHSVRQSGSPAGLGFSELGPVVTFYENNVKIDDGSRGYVSPISDNALNYYRYKLQGQFDEHGHTIYKIRVTQKRHYEPCFNGTIYIVDDDWAIHSLNLTLTKESGMDMFDTLRMSQIFLPLDKDTWVGKSQVAYYTLNLIGLDVTANFVSVYDNQKVNQPIPDSIFADKVTSAYDKNSNKKDTVYWEDARPIPLETDEQKDFVVKDSLFKCITSPGYRDSIRKKKNAFKPIGFALTGASYSTKGYKDNFKTNSLLLGLTENNIVNYNIIEGFNLAPKIYWRHLIDTGKNLHGDIAAKYGFSNRHFNTIARLYYQGNDKELLTRMWLVGIEGGKYVFQYNPDNPVLEWYNTYSCLFVRENDLKIYERLDADAFVSRNYGNGLSWGVKASYQQRLPLQNTTDYAFLNGEKSGFASNTPHNLELLTAPWVKNDAAILHATASYKPGITFTQYPDFKVANSSKWPTFTLTYDKGIPGIINSISDFDKWRFMIQQEVRLKLLGSLKYNVGTGGFLNTGYVAIPDLMHLYGNRGIGYVSPYLQSFQFAQYYQFSNKAPIYGEGHVEYNLEGLLSNKIPLLKQARWYLLFGGNAFYATQSNYYTEAFVGIDNIGWKIFRGLRVDFVQSWDSFDGHNSGIRFGLNIPALAVAKNNPTMSEW
jgi:hypothetical protein